MRTAVDYSDQLMALLPPGRAWPRSPDSWFSRLLRGLAEEFARVDGRAMDLLEEADPRTAFETLGDWERLVGLPDPCRPISDSTRERRTAIVQKIGGLGGQTPAYMIGLAASAGYDVSIQEFAPFTAGSFAGDELADDAWRHAFLVEAYATSEAQLFAVGSYAGERLRTWGSSNLECLIGRARPAQTVPLFAYNIDPEPMLWFNFIEN